MSAQAWACRRASFADNRDCYPEAQTAVWELWQVELLLTGRDLREPGGWLDFDFYEAVPVE